MKKILLETELFNSECKVVYPKYEYTDYRGELKSIICTDLSKEELFVKFPSIIGDYCPFETLPLKAYEIFKEFYRIEDKYEKRIKRNHSLFDVNDGQFEIHHPECAFEIDLLEEIAKKDNIEKLHTYIDYLDDMQRRRLIRNRLNGESIAKIARDEGVSETAVKKSIVRAIENLKKYFGQ